MSTASHLTRIDLLCARDFPAEHGWSELGTGGPGYHVAELTAGGGLQDDDPALRHAAEAQYEAERDGVASLLADRWGRPQTVGLGGIRLRALEHCEDIPEPWVTLSAVATDAYLWRTEGRWVALGVARLDPARPPSLLAVVTDLDPP
jgi:hypothetical protein